MRQHAAKEDLSEAGGGGDRDKEDLSEAGGGGDRDGPGDAAATAYATLQSKNSIYYSFIPPNTCGLHTRDV